MTWPSGDKYIGDWEADTRTGHGLYLYSSGNRYKGQYLNNKKVGGNIILTNCNGLVLLGRLWPILVDFRAKCW